mgnify:CR=1 FL=1
MNTPRAGLNMDRAQRVVVETAPMDWEASPASGVWRKKLERAGEESGQVTSVVRYAPGSRFAAHEHPLGEEIFVLSGVFADDAPAQDHDPPICHVDEFVRASDMEQMIRAADQIRECHMNTGQIIAAQVIYGFMIAFVRHYPSPFLRNDTVKVTPPVSLFAAIVPPWPSAISFET